MQLNEPFDRVADGDTFCYVVSLIRFKYIYAVYTHICNPGWCCPIVLLLDARL